MVVFKCDACRKECSPKNIWRIASFPRLTSKSVKDGIGATLLTLPDTTFAETHFCPECYNKLLNWTCTVDENEECIHEWEPTSRGGGSTNGYVTKTYTIWRCKHCGEEKKVED